MLCNHPTKSPTRSRPLHPSCPCHCHDHACTPISPEQFRALVAHLTHSRKVAAAPPTTKKRRGGRRFSDAELARIFEPSRYLSWVGHYPHRFWGPMLALYAGATSEEIARLGVSDVARHRTGWSLHLSSRACGTRVVQLHPELIDAGLPDYVEELRQAHCQVLFPHLRDGLDRVSGLPNGLSGGNNLCAQFSHYTRSLGMPPGLGLRALARVFRERIAAVACLRVCGTQAPSRRHAGSRACVCRCSRFRVWPAPALLLDMPTYQRAQFIRLTAPRSHRLH